MMSLDTRNRVHLWGPDRLLLRSQSCCMIFQRRRLGGVAMIGFERRTTGYSLSEPPVLCRAVDEEHNGREKNTWLVQLQVLR